MRTLFIISTIALMALLWASVSIASHIRRARRRRRAHAEQVASEDPATTRPASLTRKTERPDWAYFNKDLGDLRDPYEERRTKPRGPSRL